MHNNNPEGLEQLDFKLVLAFTNTYEKLYEKGEISEEQFEKVLILIDNFHKYNIEEFEEKLKQIFTCSEFN